MKKLLATLLIVFLLIGSTANATTSDIQERIIKLRNRIQTLREEYRNKLSPEERLKLILLYDKSDEYFDNDAEWMRFETDINSCKSYEELSKILKNKYIDVNEAAHGYVQSDSIRKLSIEIVQSAGFNIDDMPNIAMISQSRKRYKWMVLISAELPEEDYNTPGFTLELENDGRILGLLYGGKINETDFKNEKINKEKAIEIAKKFIEK